MADLRRCLVILTAIGLTAGCGSGTRTGQFAAPSTEHSVTATSAAAPSPVVPPVSAQAAAAGFVDVRTVVPDAKIDLRYATTNNFVGVALYPPDARCLIHDSMAPGLATAADILRKDGAVLVFWDCYRPHEVQVRMFEAVPNPAWVAKPGSFARSHETGRSVDVTFAHTDEQCPAARKLDTLCLAEMGTDFDDFSPSAEAFAAVDPVAQADRTQLREAMRAGGRAHRVQR